jgi:hypothetical protein
MLGEDAARFGLVVPDEFAGDVDGCNRGTARNGRRDPLLRERLTPRIATIR